MSEGEAIERKPHLVMWMTVRLDKRKKGLRVKSLATLNMVLFGNWSWRFANEKEAFWNQVMTGKYGEEHGGRCSREVRVGYDVGL